jgi:hypothetical protein
MSLSVHLGCFNCLASLRPRDVLARRGHIVELDRSVERSRNPYYVSPDTLLGGTGGTGGSGVTGAGPSA